MIWWLWLSNFQRQESTLITFNSFFTKKKSFSERIKFMHKFSANLKRRCSPRLPLIIDIIFVTSYINALLFPWYLNNTLVHRKLCIIIVHRRNISIPQCSWTKRLCCCSRRKERLQNFNKNKWKTRSPSFSCVRSAKHGVPPPQGKKKYSWRGGNLMICLIN